MTAIKDVTFMQWWPRENVYSFVCIVIYASGRRYKFYGRIPATVRRYFRERAFSSAPWPSCYGGKWCEARKLEDLRTPPDDYLFEAFEGVEVPF